MKIEIWYGKRYDRDTTPEEILETYSNKQLAEQIIEDLETYGKHLVPIRGSADVMTYKVIG